MTGWQRQVSDFAHRRHLLYDSAVQALDVASEAGEVAKEVLLATDYGRRAFQSWPELVGELGDLLYSVLALAEACGADAAEALGHALSKYEQRLIERGMAGSEVE
jgi:NTP pyrophosphatase (non-canonical NTP hydrolase)